MDVTCERCSTAYEFDDALVSERGTTVKCTNCGHQFKVRRPQPVGAPERWLVRTIDGRELEFRALRELQAAIAQSLISRDDVLSRGGSRPRRLGNIAELEPFFASVAGGAQQSTSLGLGPKAPPRGRPPAPAAPPPAASRPEVSVAIPLPTRDPGSYDEETVVKPARGVSMPSVPSRVPTLPGGVVGSGGAPTPPIHEESTVRGSYDDETVNASYEETTRSLDAEARAAAEELAREQAASPRRDDVSAKAAPFLIGSVVDPAKARALKQDDWAAPVTTGESSKAPAPPAEAAPERVSAPASAPSRPSAPAGDAANLAATPTPAPVRASYGGDEAYAEPRFSGVTSQRRSGGARWMVGLFVAGMVVLAAATVGRKMLPASAPAKGGEADARVAQLLAGGEKSLAEGDLELAKEQLDKASVLAERDARVVTDLARLAAVKADVYWLRTRLLADGDPEQTVARRELERAVQRARRAADRAAEIAPADPAVTRARIDALRLGGDLEGARKLVAAVAGQSSQPDNALVLAELDLAEARPDWPTVIGRLRTAVGGEGSLGRARAVLVYALVRSGDLAGGKAELERLKARPRPHPLLGALTGYLQRADKTVDVSALPDATGKARADKPAPSAAPTAAAKEPPPRERPTPVEPPAPAPVPEPPPQPLAPSGPVDTSDLPGVKVPTPIPTPQPPTPQPPSPQPPPPTPPPPTPPPANTVPPGVDTSDLPGFK